jgi:hypothetical protein
MSENREDLWQRASEADALARSAKNRVGWSLVEVCGDQSVRGIDVVGNMFIDLDRIADHLTLGEWEDLFQDSRGEEDSPAFQAASDKLYELGVCEGLCVPRDLLPHDGDSGPFSLYSLRPLPGMSEAIRGTILDKVATWNRGEGPYDAIWVQRDQDRFATGGVWVTRCEDDDDSIDGMSFDMRTFDVIRDGGANRISFERDDGGCYYGMEFRSTDDPRLLSNVYDNPVAGMDIVLADHSLDDALVECLSDAEEYPGRDRQCGVALLDAIAESRNPEHALEELGVGNADELARLIVSENEDMSHEER